MASLKEIADELGVSFSLVSKVLNNRLGSTGVSQATREAILKKAKELDYLPNPLAVALKHGRKGAVAVFLHSMGAPGSDISSRFLDAMAGAFEKTNHRLWLRFFSSDEEFRAACDKRLMREVDGLIVAGVEHPRLIADLEKIQEAGLPVVSVFCGQPHCVSPTNIAVDYTAQCLLATRHLIARGARRIAHVRTMELRYQGYMQAHGEAGLPVWPRLTVPADLYFADGVGAVSLLLDRGEAFDGLVCGSDAQAIGAIRELRRRGIDVPGAVRVTGVDDSPMAEICEVPLTSATAEMARCGDIAAETLLKKIAGESAQSIVLPPRLVIRESA